ncbi:MAG: hypothetical protein GC164_02305 [Phycisphaera sp.]|nr:hypothetical protein [Phycisphaera sp.]
MTMTTSSRHDGPFRGKGWGWGAPGNHLGLEPLEERLLLSAVAPDAYEVYMLELINRARANPAAEAALFGIDLNEGVPSNETITTDPKQPLAFNVYLNDAAQQHSQWMIDNDIFDHYGENGSSPGDRMTAAGYSFTGSWAWGENLAWQGTTGTPNVTNYVTDLHENLFVDTDYPDRGHRTNLLYANYREVGVGIVQGVFTSNHNYNAVMATNDFAKSGSGYFITGVIYNDTVLHDNFYTVGEGLSGVTIQAVRQSNNAVYNATVWDAGAYKIALPNGTYTVTATGGQLGGTVVVQEIVVSGQNVKLDFTPQMVDHTAPTADILDITPDPRNTAVGTVTVQFSEDVQNVDITDFALTINNSALSLAGLSVTQVNASTYTLDLSTVTDATGQYTLTLQTSDITDLAGNALASPASDSFSVTIPPAVFKADFDDNGTVDILWRNTATGDLLVWYFNGSTRSGTSYLGTVRDNTWQIVALNDFNSDGMTDLLWRNQTSGQNLVWLLDTNLNHTEASVPTVADTQWRIVGSADFNSDDKPDLLWHHEATGATIVWYMNGTSRTGFAPIATVADTHWQIVGLADFNNDHKTDILWRNNSTGQNLVWAMNGATRTSVLALPSVADTHWQVVALLDINNDKQTDILWRHATTGQLGIWTMSGTTRLAWVGLPTVNDLSWFVVG